ncbi:MAG: SDR family NAD(P)-dependent oxidoreductase [Spirochaetes bacterium]|nr:SDR family NAD(P)-dependent oxidoreductase [Spirochaetota bacterium]
MAISHATRNRRTALVTGATGVIGRAIVEGLSSVGTLQVLPTGRNPDKVTTLYPSHSGKVLPGIVLDQGSKDSILALKNQWDFPLHVLVINASATPKKKELTAEGIETQWAVNVLGYHRLIKAMAPLLFRSSQEAGEPSRIVLVASCWAGDLNLSDPEFKQRPYDNGSAYRQSKQAERMLAYAWAIRLQEQYGMFSTGTYKGCPFVTVNACHPGEVNTPLSNSLGFGGHESPSEGADTPVWVATAKELASVSGGWFTYRKRSVCRFASDTVSVGKLWDLVESYG